MRHLPLSAGLVLAVAIAGCGSSSSNTTPTASTSVTAKSAPSSSGGGPLAITYKNLAASPTTITAKVGEKITWTNQDPFDHNVKADSGASFQSKDFGKGGTFSFTPTKAGTITYECTIHPNMKNYKIIVTQ